MTAGGALWDGMMTAGGALVGTVTGRRCGDGETSV